MATDPNGLFGQNELLDIETAEAEELGPSPATRQAAEAEYDAQIAQLERENMELQRQHAQVQEQLWRSDERDRQIREAQEANARARQQLEEANERPDASIDPVGAQIYDLDRQTRQLAQYQQQLAQQQQAAHFNARVDNEERRFVQTQPDYADAINYVAEKRTVFWQDLGLPLEQARFVVANEAQLLTRTAAQTGKSFPQTVYNLGIFD